MLRNVALCTFSPMKKAYFLLLLNHYYNLVSYNNSNYKVVAADPGFVIFDDVLGKEYVCLSLSSHFTY